MSATEIPGYKIIRTLGVGGQATVYLAIQKGFDREVALKVMSPALAADPTFGERFIREAKIVAKLSHKSIVTVYDVGESGNFYYLAMEYLPKGDLKTRIENGLKTRDCLTIIGKLAKALHFAHEKGYIHRDVKSENILFNEDDEPVLTDFGIAKASNSSTQMTQTGKLIGTPEYMSPEQCRGKTVDGRSDIYSLGVILYEMLTRRVPYTGEDSVAVCIKHVTKPIPKLPQRLNHFQWLLESLMAKDAAKRFQTGGELAAAILKFGKTGQAQKVEKAAVEPTRVTKKHDTDEFNALPDSDDHFEELHSERRYQISEVEEKSSLGKVVAIILVLLIGVGGFFTQEQWYPKVAEWIDKTSNRETRNTAGGVNPKNPSDISQQSSNQESNTPSSADLLQEADALVQFVPQTVEDIKKALRLVATVKTLEPGNKSAQLIYQNILSSSLMEATTEAEKNNFVKAEEWLSLVQFEQPDYALLEATRTKVINLKTEFESQNSARKQRVETIDQLITSGQEALAANRLSSPANDNAIDYFQQALQIDAANTLAKQGLIDVSIAYEKLIAGAINDKKFSRAKTFLARFNSLSNDQAKKLSLRQQIATEEKSYNDLIAQRRQQAAAAEQAKLAEAARLEKLNDPMVQMRLLGSLDSARTLESQGDLVSPEGNNALEKYRAALAIDAKNQDALAGISRIEKAIIDSLTNAIADSDKSKATEWLTQLKLFDDNHPQYDSFNIAVSEIIELIPEIETPVVDSSDSVVQDLSAGESTINEPEISSTLEDSATQSSQENVAASDNAAIEDSALQSNLQGSSEATESGESSQQQSSAAEGAAETPTVAKNSEQQKTDQTEKKESDDNEPDPDAIPEPFNE
ncbi:serine/threonine protein kinase [Aliikangiella marina]|uniref:serine/threonine protein kinase n=1 Tax=Aliikangiella marina TaxID=1712262 RepID=UPI00163D46DD|nr:serine/threonine-protein kinase [Aliikangiella marina]